MSNLLATFTVGGFMRHKGFTNYVPTIRLNDNGYPFITFIDANKPKDGQAENVYLSKEASKLFEPGYRMSVADLKTLTVVQYNHEDGSVRFKLGSGTSTWGSVDDLD